MTRFWWAVAALAILVGLVGVFFARNSNKELLPFLGKWSGGFEVSQIRGAADTPQDRKRNGLHGYLQVYVSNRKFLLHLEGEQQIIDVGGTWKYVNPHRILLHPANVHINDSGGEEKRNPNLAYIPDESVMRAYSTETPMDLSADGKSLVGLMFGIPPLVGVHRFVKDSF